MCLPSLTTEAHLLIRALQHFDAHLKATKREDNAYRDLAERLKRKPPAQEVSQQITARKEDGLNRLRCTDSLKAGSESVSCGEPFPISPLFHSIVGPAAPSIGRRRRLWRC